MSTTPTFGLSRDLHNRASRESKALKLAAPEPLPPDWFESICERLRTGGLRTVMKNGLQSKWAIAEPVERLLDAALYGFKDFDPEVEATMLKLVPLAHNHDAERPREAARLVAALIGRWGLVRAVEVFAALAAQPSFPVRTQASQGWRILLAATPNPDVVAYVSLNPRLSDQLQQWGSAYPRAILQDRLDRALRAHLLHAPPDGLAAAKARAAELRTHASLLVASSLNALFVDPEWTRADLTARIFSDSPWIFNEEVLLSAPAALLVGWLEFLRPAEHESFTDDIFRRGCHLMPMGAALAAALGSEAPAVFAAWTRGVVKLERFSSTRELLEVLLDATDHVEPVEAAIAVLETAPPHKLGKTQDPAPHAMDILLRSPQVALPLVRAAAHGKSSGWAKDLLPRLGRLAAPVTYTLAEPDELPAALRPQKPFKAPAFWAPTLFIPPRLHNDKALPVEAIDQLGALLSKDSPELEQVKAACSPATLTAFAWELFQTWLAAGAPAKDKWAFMALGHFGNDDSARRLTPLIRAWPGESAHARAVLGLEVLSLIGTDVALMMLNGIAQKVKFKGLQERARDTMDHIAARRGLTAEELADRLVPDLDLDDDGSKVLDFGPRSFRVGFDETLSPFVMDASGTRLKDHPKPNSKDDPELSAASVETWKATKKDAKALASIQLLRFELAMGNARRWQADVFEALLVHHPLLVHVVRRLVWGVYDGRRLVDTFRVAEDRTFANSEDDAFLLAPDAIVGVVHRHDIDDEIAGRWVQVFSDYAIAQPFAQLTREVFRLSPEEKTSAELTRFVGRLVETKRMLGLTSRGWRRGAAQDGGNIWWFTKSIAPDVDALLRFDNGIIVGAMEYSDPSQTLGIVDFGPDDPGWTAVRPNAIVLGLLDPIIVSEVIRDLESLGEVEDE